MTSFSQTDDSFASPLGDVDWCAAEQHKYNSDNSANFIAQISSSDTFVSGLKANFFEEQLAEQLDSMPNIIDNQQDTIADHVYENKHFLTTTDKVMLNGDKYNLFAMTNESNREMIDPRGRVPGSYSMQSLYIPAYETKQTNDRMSQFVAPQEPQFMTREGGRPVYQHSTTSTRSPLYQQQQQQYGGSPRESNVHYAAADFDELQGVGGSRMGAYRTSSSPSNYAGQPSITGSPAMHAQRHTVSPTHHQQQQLQIQQQQRHHHQNLRMSQYQQQQQLYQQQIFQPRSLAPTVPISTFNGAVYQVQFKQAFRDFILGPHAPSSIAVGDFVIVECDRGEDLGVVTGSVKMSEFVERRYLSKAALDDDANDVGRILRLATIVERQQLPEKYHDEQNIIQVCTQLSSVTFKLPMRVIDAEYQYDRRKLTIYYSADSRIDFRELVRDLFSAYRTRIWMKKVSPSHPFVPVDFAVMSLSSGVQFSPK